MKIGERTATSGEFVIFIEAKQNRRNLRDAQSYVDELYEQFTQDVVKKYEESMLPHKYPEYKYIYQEYHDGILLFDIMDQKVWSKAVSDTVGLEAFYEGHKKDYMWNERSDALLVTCSEGVDVTRVRKAYKKILKGKLDEESLNSAYCNNDTILCITLKHLLVEEGEDEMVDAMKGRPGLGPVTEKDGKTAFVILKEVRSPEPKKLMEARGQITSDYQNYLEQEWIKELKQKYPVEVNRSLLSSIKP
jgi:peptidyl-prolyl cis-trans isomerase SurA